MINIADYSMITEEQFKAMQFDSGVIVKDFDPANPSSIKESDILCATTGDISVNSEMELVDLGEDVNNLHGKLKEMQYLSNWTHTLGFTALDMTTETIHLALGAADVVGNKVTPRNYIKDEDFQGLWWVGMLIGGGFAAVHITDALSNSGLSLSTSKDGKGNLSVTLEGYGTIKDSSKSPMEYYSIPETGISLSQNKAALSLGDTLRLSAAVTISDPDTVTPDVSWTSSIPAVVAVQDTTASACTITANETGTSVITASITVNNKTYTDTCTITVTASTGA